MKRLVSTPESDGSSTELLGRSCAARVLVETLAGGDRPVDSDDHVAATASEAGAPARIRPPNAEIVSANPGKDVAIGASSSMVIACSDAKPSTRKLMAIR